MRERALQQFAARLVRLRRRAGAPTLRELEALSAGFERRLMRSTVAEKLAGKSLPDWDFVLSFITACTAYARARGIDLPPGLTDTGAWDRAHLALLRSVDEARAAVPFIAAARAHRRYRFGGVPALVDCRQPRPVDEVVLAAGAGGCQVLTGLGGVGKTQLAAVLAHTRWGDATIDTLVWVNAGSAESITTAYARAARDLTGVRDTDPEVGADRFLAWLAEPPERPWLVVLDDLADPADLARRWPPSTGTTVITTRRRDAALAGAGRRLVDVGLFTADEATRYLRQKLGAGAGRLGEVDELAADLGYLPLGLAQAAAYLIDRNLTCADYRRRLADRRRRLADLVPEPGALPDEHRVTIASTWSLSVDRADRLNPVGVARPVLELASLLDPNAIPAALFTTPAALAYVRARRATAEPVEAEDARDALHCLHRLSLLTVDPGPGVVRVHALVQRTIREQLGADDRARALPAVAEALLHLWPEDERDLALGAVLRASAAALRTHGVDRLWASAGYRVLFRAGRSLGEAGLIPAAIGYWARLRADAEARLGPDHVDTLRARGDQARWWANAGDLRRAVAAFANLLVDQIRVLGPDHPDCLRSRHEHAYSRGEAGEYVVAAEETAAVLRDMARVLGPDHAETLNARHNLVCWWGEAGEVGRAAAGLERLLADRLRLLGPDHPDTLTTRHDLALWWARSGDLDGALAEGRRLLADRTRVLGPEHPDTLPTWANLARWRGQAGDPAGALAETEEIVRVLTRVLGPEHPRTLHNRGSLAHWRRVCGEPEAARSAFEAVLVDQLRVCGPTHPKTLLNRYGLALCHLDLGDRASAEDVLTDLLVDQMTTLGASHPETRKTRRTLDELARSRAGPLRPKR